MGQQADALGVFTSLWAQTMVLQVVKLALSAAKAPLDPLAPSPMLLWTLGMASACLAGLLAPCRSSATVYLCAMSLAVLMATGSQSNHVFMDVVVCLAALLTFSRDRRRWLAQATHAMRLFLVSLYLITALHKLNADWADPEWSCCTLMLVGVFALPPLRPALTLLPLGIFPHLATLVELGLPALLLIGGDTALRTAAVVGGGFHLVICQMLSPMSVYPFSVLMLPLYVFVIPDQSVRAFSCARRFAPLLTPLFAAACAAWTPLMAGGDLPEGEAPFEYPAYGCWAPGVVWCLFGYSFLIVSAIFLGSLGADGSAAAGDPAGAGAGAGARASLLSPSSQSPSSSSTPALRPTWAGRLLAIAVWSFGFMPYLGLRNYPALAMFSNLRVEGGRGNHLFLGDDFDLTGWQRDYVTIHQTDVPALLLMQVDLAPKFTPETRFALATSGVYPEFWITPPLSAWPYEATRPFKPYSMPFIELRRRVAPLRASLGSRAGFVRYSRTFAKPRLRLLSPEVWRWLGREVLEADQVHENLTYDLSIGGDSELEQPLPPWLAALARFRSFDLEYSPCRH